LRRPRRDETTGSPSAELPLTWSLAVNAAAETLNDLPPASATAAAFRVAAVEDDAVIREALEKWIGELGHEVDTFGSGEELVAADNLRQYSLFILDWGLPGVQGIDLLHQLRTNLLVDAPVIFCTSRDAETDVVSALAAGADDFIVKPIRKHELSARIAAALRRSFRGEPMTPVLSFPPYSIDLADRVISLNGLPMDLQNREYELALMLFKNLNGVVSRERIIQTLWGNIPLDSSRSLDTHVSRIRRKLHLSPENGITLHSVYGRGYRLQSFVMQTVR
jgi:two-component system, OmpR family, response regulator RegX3